MKHADLIVATHGRGFWILDDIRPLREYTPELARKTAHLFKPESHTRIGYNWWIDYGGGPPSDEKYFFVRNAEPGYTFYERGTVNGERKRAFIDAGDARPQPIWETVIAKQPDEFLFLGDAIYSDTDGNAAWSITEKQLQGEWNRLADKPDFQQFRARVPIMATWDNHDYGTHDGGADFELKEVSKKIFLDFFGEPAQSKRRRRVGIYDARVFGPEGQRVQIILFDTRTFRGPFKPDDRSKEKRVKIGKVGKYMPHIDSGAPLLGDGQWEGLEKQLQMPADIRRICSSTQIIPDKKGMDEWGCFPYERQRLFDLILATEAHGVILLSGNVHFAEISQVDTKAYALLDFTSSGLTHIDEAYAKAANEFRVAGPLAELNFGLVEIEWATKPSPRITMQAIGHDGFEGFTHCVSLVALK